MHLPETASFESSRRHFLGQNVSHAKSDGRKSDDKTAGEYVVNQVLVRGLPRVDLVLSRGGQVVLHRLQGVQGERRLPLKRAQDAIRLSADQLRLGGRCLRLGRLELRGAARVVRGVGGGLFGDLGLFGDERISEVQLLLSGDDVRFQGRGVGDRLRRLLLQLVMVVLLRLQCPPELDHFLTRFLGLGPRVVQLLLRIREIRLRGIQSGIRVVDEFLNRLLRLELAVVFRQRCGRHRFRVVSRLSGRRSLNGHVRLGVRSC
ncbi:hypothetical protein CLOM_g8406 [Closterium sp. NIES-68]|nr:hypothetical protein CLOM_g8404 [Closterium sp. NIES-68]GJP49156.1 hypothetical protein CLOM_g8406 [Closterium sp. NIES-68]GJP70314.1 hypothetical protein CLOP_g1261 [Closterium sp. NIES-67]GJP70316.1 hypothetical protein CLOP_g1263 [Closterium sp. NIES-67]